MHYAGRQLLHTLGRMSTTEQIHTFDAEREFIAAAAELGSKIEGYAAAHDLDGTFVDEAYDVMRASGYLALAVPTELGGHGATIRQVTMAQRELARHCASTALASSMHHHVVLFTAWRYRRGLPGAEATLRRVADEGIVLVSTGGADTTRPRGKAEAVDGGYLVSGRKIFASQSPVGDGAVDDVPLRRPRRGAHRPEHGRPDGGRRRDRARHLGRDGHARHGQPRCRAPRRVRARRQGARPPPVRPRRPAAAGHLRQRLPSDRRGVPRRGRVGPRPRRRRRRRNAAGRRPVRAAPGRPDATHWRGAAWALDGALAVVGDDPTPSMDTRGRGDGGQARVALAGLEVCELAMEVGGGAAFYRTSRSSSASATSAAPSSTRSPPRRRSPTPARSPSASPPTSAESSLGAADQLIPRRLRISAVIAGTTW